MQKQRATQTHEKVARRQSIIVAAWQLFQSQRYDAVTVAAVATNLGLAKGTIFVYFPTKEALFLAVLEQQLAQWFAEVNRLLTMATAPLPAARLAQLLADALLAQPHLARLLVVQATVLEANVDVATALAFKRALLVMAASTSVCIESALPFLAPGQGMQVLLWVHALVVGLWQQADAAPSVQQAFAQDSRLHPFIIDFLPAFTQALTALLHGLESESVGR